ncbi:2-methylisocitrate lyase-like PEP mutase family enzyme [Rhodoligotrophos appendicifer]|uniref:isocitrate lyase/PEP mutase family protein n=1 Tax=Rhodoligotrophos appendicifer TaxID=987056 RepID=UPI0011847383|nr:isocitrate lyase/PEP mutase family protein [Rhodoligotrophos appendicifer]
MDAGHQGSKVNRGTTTTRHLRRDFEAGRFVLAPGVFEMISALVADKMGFTALYMTGYGVSSSHLGLPDVGLASFTDMLERARRIAGGTSTPLIADADTGYGGLINVHHTVREYEAAGVQAIQLEDQDMPKKCGHTRGRRVIPLKDMLQKIDVAANARRDDDTLIIARTDARETLGLDEAIARAKAFAAAGADIIFVEAPETMDEFKRIGGEIDAWLLANMVPSGLSPEIDADALKSWGYSASIYPTLGIRLTASYLAKGYDYLLRNGSTIGMPLETISMTEMHELVGFQAIWEFERKYSQATQQ